MTEQQRHTMITPPETARYTDYFEVETVRDRYIVSFATARHIERCLATAATPDWIEFRDVFGVRHRLPALYIHRITESSGGLRAIPRDSDQLPPLLEGCGSDTSDEVGSTATAFRRMPFGQI